MHSDRQLYAGRPRAYARVRVADARHESDSISVRIAYALASAIFVLWLTYLSAATATVLSKLNVPPERLSFNETVNRTHKTGRPTVAPFNDRWSALATSGKLNIAQRTGRIPDGCDPAFSSLVKVGNFTSRCVT